MFAELWATLGHFLSGPWFDSKLQRIFKKCKKTYFFSSTTSLVVRPPGFRRVAQTPVLIGLLISFLLFICSKPEFCPHQCHPPHFALSTKCYPQPQIIVVPQKIARYTRYSSGKGQDVGSCPLPEITSPSLLLVPSPKMSSPTHKRNWQSPQILSPIRNVFPDPYLTIHPQPKRLTPTQNPFPAPPTQINCSVTF